MLEKGKRKEKRNARDGRKRTNLGAIVTASTTTAENLANKGSWRVSAEGNASGNGVINKSVNDVSGLMLVVTRSLGGLGRWHHSMSYRRISPSPRRLNRFQPGRSFDSLFFYTNKRIMFFYIRRSSFLPHA